MYHSMGMLVLKAQHILLVHANLNGVWLMARTSYPTQNALLLEPERPISVREPILSVYID